MKKELTIKEKVSKFFLENEIDIQSACNQFGLSLGDFSEEELDFLVGFKKQLKDPTKNQHYVPQFHLKQFENSGGRIETLNKRTGKILRPQSKKSICSGLYFYAEETGKPDILSQLIERQFQGIEDEFALIYNNLVGEILENKQINESYIYTLCLFVNNLHLRSKRFREHLEESHADITKQTFSMWYKMAKAHTPNDPKVVAISQDEAAEKMLLSNEYDLQLSNNAIHLDFLLDERNFFGFANLLKYQKIRFFIATGENNFVTSDNPVIELNPGPIQGFYGFSYAQRLHYFTLNPRILVEFSDPNKPGKKVKRKQIDNEKVVYYNVIRSAYSDYLYSPRKSDLEEELFTTTRINYIEDFFKLMPENFMKDKELIDKYKGFAEVKGIKYTSNYDLLKKLNLVF